MQISCFHCDLARLQTGQLLAWRYSQPVLVWTTLDWYSCLCAQPCFLELLCDLLHPWILLYRNFWATTLYLQTVPVCPPYLLACVSETMDISLHWNAPTMALSLYWTRWTRPSYWILVVPLTISVNHLELARSLGDIPVLTHLFHQCYYRSSCLV